MIFWIDYCVILPLLLLYEDIYVISLFHDILDRFLCNDNITVTRITLFLGNWMLRPDAWDQNVSNIIG